MSAADKPSPSAYPLADANRAAQGQQFRVEAVQRAHHSADVEVFADPPPRVARRCLAWACALALPLCAAQVAAQDVSDFDESEPATETVANDYAAEALPLFLEGQVHWLRVLKDQADARSVWKRVRSSPLFDEALQMYKLNASLAACTDEIGRARTFTPGCHSMPGCSATRPGTTKPTAWRAAKRSLHRPACP